MKKAFKIILLVVVVLVLIIILYPIISSNETCTYEEAVDKYATGKFVSVNGKKIHYIEKGSGQPVILIHGFLYNTVMWEKNVDALAENFKVYVIDLWGWGYSERLKETEYSFKGYGEQVTGFMDALNIKKASLIGQSMGGGTSVYVAAHYPERINRLILVDPAVIPYPARPAGRVFKLPFVGEFMNAIPGKALLVNGIKTVWFYDKSKVTEEYSTKVLQPLCIKGSYDGMMYIARNVLKDPYVKKEANMLANMNIPILLVHGREDVSVPLSSSEMLNDLWKGSKLVIFEKARHSPHEEYPGKFNELAIDFLSK